MTQSDLAILASFAEKGLSQHISPMTHRYQLQPGAYMAIFGDVHKREQQVVNLLVTF